MEHHDQQRTRPVWDPATGTWQTPGQVRQVHVPEPPLPPPGRTPQPGGMKAGVTGGIVGALLASVLVVSGMTLFGSEPDGGTIVERRNAPSVGASRDTSSIVGIAEKARPWVVNIDVQGRRGGLFGGVVQGTGSGVIYRSDGMIMTNAHVVEGAQQVSVTFANGQTVAATVVGTDPDTDIAVVKADRGDLPPAELGSAKDLEVGELAVAIGSPLGLKQTVTAGIVSALGRTVDREDQGLPPLVDMIQTDAAVTTGNSGGALLDATGALVGINTAIAASAQVGAEGIAFAIPIDIAKSVAEELIATGRATHPWMGVSLGTIDEQVAQRFNTKTGAVIEQVVPGAPAERAGLQQNDIVTSIDGTRVESAEDLVVEIRKRKVGDTVKLEIVRDGATSTIEVTLGDKPRQ